MDPSSVLVIGAVAAVVVLAPRAILSSVGTASDLFAQLWVPPDRRLGWPHGVQESDEPWAWRPPAGLLETPDAGPDGGPTGELIPLLFEIEDVAPIAGCSGGFVVPVRRVHAH